MLLYCPLCMREVKTARELSLSEHLCMEHSNRFTEWFDPDRFDWETASWALAYFCSQYFDVWWNSDRYNWERSSWALLHGCSNLFHKWWNSVKFDWEHESWSLAYFCSRYFEIWWDSNRFDWIGAGTALVEHCSQYVGVWFPHYLERASMIPQHVRQNMLRVAVDEKVANMLRLVEFLQGG